MHAIGIRQAPGGAGSGQPAGGDTIQVTRTMADTATAATLASSATSSTSTTSPTQSLIPPPNPNGDGLSATAKGAIIGVTLGVGIILGVLLGLWALKRGRRVLAARQRAKETPTASPTNSNSEAASFLNTAYSAHPPLPQANAHLLGAGIPVPGQSNQYYESPYAAPEMRGGAGGALPSYEQSQTSLARQIYSPTAGMPVTLTPSLPPSTAHTTRSPAPSQTTNLSTAITMHGDQTQHSGYNESVHSRWAPSVVQSTISPVGTPSPVPRIAQPAPYRPGAQHRASLQREAEAETMLVAGRESHPMQIDDGFRGMGGPHGAGIAMSPQQQAAAQVEPLNLGAMIRRGLTNRTVSTMSSFGDNEGVYHEELPRRRTDASEADIMSMGGLEVVELEERERYYQAIGSPNSHRASSGVFPMI